MAEGGNGPLEEVAPTVPVEAPEKMLTPAQSLHSIAVELARQNRLTTQTLQLQATQIQLVQNVLDILRAQMQNAGQSIGEQQDKAMAMIDKFMDPLMAMAKFHIDRPPKITAEPVGPQTVTTEKGGTRITADPEAEVPCP